MARRKKNKAQKAKAGDSFPLDLEDSEFDLTNFDSGLDFNLDGLDDLDLSIPEIDLNFDDSVIDLNFDDLEDFRFDLTDNLDIDYKIGQKRKKRTI